MPTSFSLMPKPGYIVACIANALLIAYLLHVIHKLTKTVLFSDFIRWNELKRYHFIATVLGIGLLLADIIFKSGCSPIQNGEEQLPLECNILFATIKVPLLFSSTIPVIESVVFSYCRLYMILPGTFSRQLTKTKEWTKELHSGEDTNSRYIF
jgi:hypothetical protein